MGVRNSTPISSVLIGLALLTLALYFSGILKQPRANVVTTQASASTATRVAANVPARELSGKILLPLENPNTELAALIADTQIANSQIKNNTYNLKLPTHTTALLGPANKIKPPHGYSSLKSSGLGSEIKLVLYQDQNNNHLYDAGESQFQPALLPSNTDAGMAGFFKYELVLLTSQATLKGKEDSSTGAKNYYRYDLDLKPGYNIIEGELASNGYENRQATGNTWDLVLPSVQGGGGKSGPALFKP